MALPIIAAGVAARYGAKKLAKELIKRNTKKNVKENPELLKKKPYKYKTTLQSEKKGRIEIYTYDKITSPRHKKLLNTLKPLKSARPK